MAKKSSKKNAKSAVKFAKKYPLILIVVLVLAFIIAVAAIAVYFVKPDIYHRYFGTGKHTWSEWETVTEATCGRKGLQSRVCTVCDEYEETVIPATGNHSIDSNGICSICSFDENFFGVESDVEAAEFSIHVIDLGKEAGDSIYIKAGDNDILIDAGASGSCATLICDYLSNYVTDGKLEYVIATHADTDHIAAFAGNASGGTRTGVLYQYKVDTLIKFDNVEEDKNEKADNLKTEYGKFMAAVKHAEDNGATVYTAGECYNESGTAKRQYWLDSEHTLSMNILYNYYYYNVSGDENNHSVVTLFTKETEGEKLNYLFTGDLEEDGESKLVDYYKSVPADKNTEYNVLPQNVNFYKAGHHGSGTSSTAKLLDVIQPQYIAISCCAGAPQYTKNNDNTFPYKKVFETLLKYTDKIYCTGVAKDLPKLKDDGNFEPGSYEYEAYNGNIVFFLNAKTTASGTTYNNKLYCSSGNFDSIIESDWYKQYRNGN